jgi:hypothetical protein
VVPTRLAERQIAGLRGRPRASFLLAVDDILRRGCAAAGVRLTGVGISSICRLDLYGAWRLLSVFESADRCVVLMVAEHTREENPYRLIYETLGISEPAGPRTKPSYCDPDGEAPIDPDLAQRLEAGLAELARALQRPRRETKRH